MVGQPVVRVEDARLVSGGARFGADIHLHGELHAVFVRSAHAHAAIESVDVSAARRHPGVAAVFVADDIDAVAAPLTVRSLPTFTVITHGPLAKERARYVGDPIAVVLAETAAAAIDAAETVEVEYATLPTIIDWSSATAPGAPAIWSEATGNVLWELTEQFGRAEDGHPSGLDVHLTIEGNRVANAPLECRTILVQSGPGGTSLGIWSGTQNPQGLRAGLASTFGLRVADVRVRTPDIGGSFGQKGWMRPEDVVVTAAALLTRRPVRWVETRGENLMSAGHARDDHAELTASVTPDGIVRTVRASVVLDQGAYPVHGSVRDGTCRIIRTLLPGPYRIGHLDYRGRLVATNKGSYVTYRGPWATESLIRERLMERVARQVGVEPLELRRRNLVDDDDPTSAMITGPSLAGLTLRQACDTLEAHLDLPAFRHEQRSARADGRYIGVGVALVLEPAPGPANYLQSVGGFVAPPEPALVRLEIDGSITVLTAQVPSGQGHETTFAQLASDALGIPISRIAVGAGDTAAVPFSLYGTGGSRAAFRAGGAITLAATELRNRIVEVAAALLEASPDDLVVDNGTVSIQGTPARSVTLAAVAMAGWHGAALLADRPGRFEVTMSHALPGPGWSQAAHAAVVSVDIETGRVTVDRYVVVADCGTVINPAVVEGQVQGGVAQGLASVLYESIRFDDAGQPLCANLAEYRMPSALEVPDVEVVHLPAQPGAAPRGVGEGGAIGSPPAVLNAIEDALAPFGFQTSAAHVTPESIVTALKGPVHGTTAI